MESFTGTLVLVLNAHFPYVRRAGRWPHGEESLHEVIAESYLPLFDMLHELSAPGKAVPLSLAVSPILLHQLGDLVINKHFSLWLEDRQERARRDLQRFEAAGDGHLAYLSRFYLELAESAAATFEKRFDRNILRGLRGLPHEHIDLLLAPATAAYLPRLDEGALRAQLQTGALTTFRLLGRRPRGFWLPFGVIHRRLPALLAEMGLRFAAGPAGDGPMLSRADNGDLLLLAGDRAVTEHVMAPGLGYPGDGLYREFHRTDDESGLHYWRVTGVDVPLGAKAYYDPYQAFERAEEHARHWLHVLEARLQALARAGRPPVVVVALDAELFGHWWFEGVAWLRRVLRELGERADIRAATLSDVAALWGAEASIASASPAGPDEAQTADLWRKLAVANEQMGAAARRYAAAEGLTERILAQAARELLLAASGDWFTLIARGSAPDYARRRFDEHLARFDQLLRYIKRPDPDAETYLARIEELDNAFPHLNYRVWG